MIRTRGIQADRLTGGTRRFLVVFGLLSLALHWAWEVAHGPAFVETTLPVMDRVWHCAPMAAVDAGWAAILVMAAGGLSRARRRHRQATTVVLAAVLGAVTAVLFELWALRSGRWTYSDVMPQLPLIGVGVWPVLQMSVLPPVVYLLAVAAAARAAEEPRMMSRENSHGSARNPARQ